MTSSKGRKKPGYRLALVPSAGCVCEQCLMQASRGFVFHEEFNPHGSVNGACRCRFMPGIEGKTKIEGYDTEECRKGWKAIKSAREKLGLGDDKMKAVLKDMGVTDPTKVTAEQVERHITLAFISKMRYRLKSEYKEGFAEYLDGVSSADLSRMRYDKQMQHIEGTDQYLKELNRGEVKGCFEGIDYDGIVSLIRELSGTGYPIICSNGKWSGSEIVYAGRMIGYTLSSKGIREPTNMLTIRYSKKKGVHAVPKHDDRKKNGH